MYKIERLEKTQRVFNQRFDWHPGLLAGASHVEVWGSSFDDPGPDFCEFRLIGTRGEILETRHTEGY